MTIQRGATVQLENSQSPLMTVEKIEDGQVTCVWFARSGDGVWAGPFRGQFAYDLLDIAPNTEVS